MTDGLEERDRPTTPATSRRRYVALLAGLSTTALAGCGGSGDGGDGGTTTDGGGGTDGADGGDGGTDDETDAGTETSEPSGPASFSAVAVEVSETASVGETTVTVTATNDGGETGTFEGTLTVADGPGEASADVVLEEVPPGETASTDVTLSLDFAGEYALELTGEGASARRTVAVGPATPGPGESVSLGENLTATLSDVEFANGLYVEEIGRNYAPNVTPVLFPETGDLFAVVRFEVANDGSSEVSIGSPDTDFQTGRSRFDVGSERLSLARGALVESFTVAGYPQSLSSLFVDGPTLYGQTIAPGESATGWLLVETPDADDRTVPITWQRDDGETPPEVRWTVGGEGMPDLSLAEWTLPSEAQQGEVDHQFTVANEGEATARVAVEVAPVGDRLSGSVAPGESETFEYTFSWPYSEAVTVELRPYAERDLDLTPRQLTAGEGGLVPWGTATVEEIVLTDQIDGTATNGEEGPWDPRNGMFVLVNITHDRWGGPVQSDDPNYAQNVFRVEVGDESYRFHSTSDNSGAHVAGFSEPVVGSWGPDSVEVDGTASGWLAFDVPSVDAADVTVRGRYQDGCRIEWRQK